MTNWTDIHKDFEYYQKIWEQNNFTYQEAKAWIEVGLTLDDYNFASYLKQNNYQPNNLPKTIDELKTEYETKSQELAKNPQEWLDYFYPKQQTKEILIYSEQFRGSLIISNYPNLEKILIGGQKYLTNLQINNCSNLRELIVSESKLTSLDLTNLPNLEILRLSGCSLTNLNLNLTNNKKLKDLRVSYNNLTNLNINHLKDLETLDVSSNNLAELNISNLVNLKWLSCSENSLTNLDLSKNLGLERLRLENNNLNQDLSFLKDCVNLKFLSLENNNFYGDLEPLKNMSKLEELYISSTDINSGLEYLPDSLEYFYCSAKERKDAKCKVIYDSFADEKGTVATSYGIENFPQKLKEYKKFINEGLEGLPENCKILYFIPNTKIAKQLSKYKEKDPDDKTYYNISRWREDKQEDKQNKEIVALIPLERLFVIRGNLKQFINKWGVKDKKEPHGLDKLLIKCKITKDESELTRLEKLKSPKQLNENQWTKRRNIDLAQFIGRSSAVVGVALIFQDSQAVGGGILGVYPLVELVVSKMEKSLADGENEWKEFLDNADNFLDNYNELLGILAPFEEIKEVGKVSKALLNLDKEVKIFLDKYDQEDKKTKKKNGEIDLEELIAKWKELVEDVGTREDKNSKLWELVDEIKKLEKVIIEHRKEQLGQQNKSVSPAENNLDKNKELEIKPEETKISIDEYEANQSLNNSQANLLDKSKQNEEIEMQTQIIQQQPFSSSNKPK